MRYLKDLVARLQAQLGVAQDKLGLNVATLAANTGGGVSLAAEGGADVAPWMLDKDVTAPLLTAYDARIAVRDVAMVAFRQT